MIKIKVLKSDSWGNVCDKIDGISSLAQQFYLHLMQQDTVRRGSREEIWKNPHVTGSSVYVVLRELVDSGHMLRLYTKRESGSRDNLGDIVYYISDSVEIIGKKVTKFRGDPRLEKMDMSVKFARK